MTHQQQIGRRTFLRTAGGIALGSVVAGCMSAGDTYGSGSAGDEDGSSSGDEWLSDAKSYDGTITDLTGKPSVIVEIGPNDHPYAFSPPAIRISPDTTVTWKWRGDGFHNVVATDEQFSSGDPQDSGTFKHTFATTGTFNYSCKPHESMGMKGAVIVSDSKNGAGGSNETTGNTHTETTNA